MTTTTEPRYTTIQGQRALVLENTSPLPQKLDDLLRAMEQFGFAYRDDFTPSGTRRACEVANDHRFATIREGRWWNPKRTMVQTDASGTVRGVLGGVEMAGARVIEPGLLLLRVEMCRDCGAVCVRDISPDMGAGARPARLVNRLTGAVRIAPVVGQRNVVLGWYSGSRRNGREYR